MKLEILAPAGNLEKMKWALMYGADAVYLGGKNYSLRANANNFTIEEIKEAVSFAHKLNKKIYVTVNMIFHNEDIKGLDEYLKELDKLKVDAVIVSDMAVIESIKRQKLKLPFHISTQMSITNKKTAEFYKKLGAERIVLARECSKEDIKDIKENVEVELEMFIHGAMCTSYSGRCVLSNYVTSRDSNRGGCSQVCRFTFNAGYKNLFSFSTKDLNMASVLKEIYEMQINSLKIEGRMRSIYYISTIVNTYKRILEDISMNNLTDKRIEYYTYILNRCANRESTVQFFSKQPGVNEQYYTGREEKTNKDFLGVVIEYNKETKEALIEQRNYFSVGDEIEVFSPIDEPYSFTVQSIKTLEGDNVSAARHPKEKLYIKIEKEVKQNDIIRVKMTP